MALQNTEIIELGALKVSDNRSDVLTIPSIGTSMALILYDFNKKMGALAHIALPESYLAGHKPGENPGKYADLAVPELIQQFTDQGGQTKNSLIAMVGGAQLFNFGGGGGSFMNIGSRNATVIKTSLTKFGLTIEKSDIGGSKAKSLRFLIATGQIYIKQLGAPKETLL